MPPPHAARVHTCQSFSHAPQVHENPPHKRCCIGSMQLVLEASIDEVFALASFFLVMKMKRPAHIMPCGYCPEGGWIVHDQWAAWNVHNQRAALNVQHRWSTAIECVCSPRELHKGTSPPLWAAQSAAAAGTQTAAPMLCAPANLPPLPPDQTLIFSSDLTFYARCQTNF